MGMNKSIALYELMLQGPVGYVLTGHGRGCLTFSDYAKGYGTQSSSGGPKTISQF